jgi:hypothetical protein
MCWRKNGEWFFTLQFSTKSATFTAETSVVRSFELMAFSTMFLEGYIEAPLAVAFFVFERINSFRTLIQ